MGTRGSRGFTFVEAMAVAIIVAILAAAAIPMYNGYIQNQRLQVVRNLAKTAAVSANVFYRRHNRNPTEAELNIFLSDPARYDLNVDGNDIVVTDNLGGGDVVSHTESFR